MSQYEVERKMNRFRIRSLKCRRHLIKDQIRSTECGWACFTSGRSRAIVNVDGMDIRVPPMVVAYIVGAPQGRAWRRWLSLIWNDVSAPFRKRHTPGK